VEICHLRRRDRGSRDESCLTKDAQQILESPGPNWFRRIQVNEPKFDLASNAELQNGRVLLSQSRNVSGIVVQPFRAATVCEFEPVLKTDRVMQFGSDHGYRSCKYSNLINSTLPNPPDAAGKDFRRDDETHVKDRRFAHAGFAGAPHP
jgi:hypothetical protein